MQLEYKVSNNVTPQQLKDYGFHQRTKGKYALNKNLYKNIIRVKILIDLSNRIMTWEVYDVTNQKQYHAFYNNVNGDSNRVAIKSIEEFNKIIDNLLENKIIKEDK